MYENSYTCMSRRTLLCLYLYYNYVMYMCILILCKSTLAGVGFGLGGVLQIVFIIVCVHKIKECVLILCQCMELYHYDQVHMEGVE